MKIQKIEDVNIFLEAVNKAKSNVYLTSIYGDRYNLKSILSQYLAVAALVGTYGDELELWCDSKEDEGIFVKMFFDHPELI